MTQPGSLSEPDNPNVPLSSPSKEPSAWAGLLRDRKPLVNRTPTRLADRSWTCSAMSRPRQRPQSATICLNPKHRPTLSTCWTAGVDSTAWLLGAIGSERKRYGRMVAGHTDCGGVHRRSHAARVPRFAVGGGDVASPQQVLSAATIQPTFWPACPQPCSQRSDSH